MVRRAISTARSRGVVGVINWISFRPRRRGPVHHRLRLLDREIGHDHPVQARGRRVIEKALHTQAVDDRVRDHRDQRRLVELRRTLGAKRAQGLKNVPHLDPSVQGTVIARGDHGAVGDRIGIRDPDLDQVRAALDQLVDQDGRRPQVGVARGQERHQSRPAVVLEPGEKGIDPVHGFKSSRVGKQSATHQRAGPCDW